MWVRHVYRLGVDVGVDIGVDVGVDMGVDVGIEIGVGVGADMFVDVACYDRRHGGSRCMPPVAIYELWHPMNNGIHD